MLSDRFATGEPTDQLGWIDAQGGRELRDVHKGDVPFASLEGPDVVPMEAGDLGEPLLGQPEGLAAGPDPIAEGSQQLLFRVRRHPDIETPCIL